MLQYIMFNLVSENW